MAGRPGAGRIMRRIGFVIPWMWIRISPRRATRSRQNLIMKGDVELPDKAAIEMGGSPVHKREKGDLPYAGGANIV